MKTVCDSSSLINLARIGALGLLREVFGEVWIPRGVWEEVVVQGGNRPGALEIETSSWIRVQDVSGAALVDALRLDLDRGESEAIVLALEIQADLLVIDERLGRAFAESMGLRCTGLLGVLLVAKQKGLIDSVKPYLDALRQQAGFWISDALYMQVLEDAGELSA